MSQAKRIALLANVVSSAELDRPELRVVPISVVAAELGVSTEAISEAVRIATIGDIGANLAKFDVGERQVPIRVQLDARAPIGRPWHRSKSPPPPARRCRMLPSAFGLGSGGEFRAPMVIAVIGGLMSSMLLSLVFVPAVFSVMDDVTAMIWGHFRRCIGAPDELAALEADANAQQRAQSTRSADRGGVKAPAAARVIYRVPAHIPRVAGPRRSA